MKIHNPNHNDKIILGFISGLSGVYGWMAEDQLRGVTLAVELINSHGGIAGREVKIVTKDDESNAEKAQAGARALIKEDGADCIIGSLSASTHLYINKETKKAGVLFMSIGQSSEITMAPHLGPLTFHEAITPYISGQGMGEWVAENLGKKWVLIVADYEWGWSVTESYKEIAKRSGIEILKVIKVPFPAKDEQEFAEHFSSIIRLKPEVLIACNFGKDQLNFIKAAGKADLKRRMSIVNTISEFPIIERTDAKTAAGIYWGCTFYWGLRHSEPSAKSFVAKYQKRFKKIPSGYSAYGYSGGLELLEAAQRNATYPLDSVAIAKDLEGRAYAHYKKPQWWRPCDHQSFQDFYILKIKGPEDRENVSDLAEVIGSTSWGLDMEKTCEDLGHKNRMWGHQS